METAIIRSEVAGDHGAIRDIHRLAFSGDGEGKLVDDLRQAGDLVIALVAEREGHIVGHIAFSKLDAPMRALSLAPVGVHPDLHNQGIGSALIKEGLERARRDGWQAVFVLGDPAYYQRFGFDIDAAKTYGCPYSGEHFMVKFLDAAPLPKSGRLIYPVPFGALG